MAIYHIYGSKFAADFPFRMIEAVLDEDAAAEDLPRFELQDETWFRQRFPKPVFNQESWFFGEILGNGSLHLSWKGLGEFRIDWDPIVVSYRLIDEERADVFESYLLQQVLSFILIKNGRECFHGSALIWRGKCIVLLGDSGYGKSTLTSHFLANGATLISDDLLLLEEGENGKFSVAMGLPQIKLYPDSLQQTMHGKIGTTLNPVTNKAILQLDHHLSVQSVPIDALYVMKAPNDPENRRENVLIAALRGMDAIFALYHNLFNPMVHNAHRQTQLLRSVDRIIKHIPIRQLVYPRQFTILPQVLAAIASDLGVQGGQENCR